MMMRMGLAALVLLTGCAVVPRVDYRRLADPQRAENWVPYALTDTLIVIGKAGAPGPGDGLAAPIDFNAIQALCDREDGCQPGIAALAVPVDYAGTLLAIVPRSQHLVSTSVAPAYHPDSLRLKSLTIEATDHRVEAINAIGAVAAGTLGLAKGVRAAVAAPAAAAALRLPVAIDLAEARDGASHALPDDNDGWTYTARLEGDPAAAGAIPLAARDRIHGALLTSSCRPLRIELANVGAGLSLVLRLRVADPEWLMQIPFPAKGAVTLHPLCGADVQSQSVTAVGADALANAIFAQARAIRAARRD